MNRTIVIGDIHGGLKALFQVFEFAKIDANDKLIFLGDYVDGWSESSHLIEFLIDLSAKQSCIFIKGNHDEWCEAWLRTCVAEPKWLIHGGQATVDSYARYDAAQKQQHLNFFEQMKMYETEENNRLFIHAGFTSMHGPEQEFYASNYKWDRTLWELALAMDRHVHPDSLLYPKRLKLFTEIFIGHTPTINYKMTEPMHAMNVWNIDTGAAFDGKLTVMDVDTKQFWQSETVRHLYPGEKGRNKS